MIHFLLSISPVILIFALVLMKRDLLTLSLVSLAYTALLALTVFKTSPAAVLLSAIDGVLTTLPLLLVVYAGILISQFLIEKKSLQRLTNTFSKGLDDGIKKVLLICAGLGNLFEGAGVIAEPVVAPMLYSVGTPPTTSAVLSILGYSGFMHLALAGVIVTVLSNVTGISSQELAPHLALLSFPATLFLYLTIPTFMGTPEKTLKDSPLILLVSVVGALFTYLAVAARGIPISAMAGGLGITMIIMLLFRVRIHTNPHISKDLAPFVFLFISLSTVNLVAPVRDLLTKKLAFTVTLLPIHPITFKPLASAYLYIFTAFLISYMLLEDEKRMLSRYLTGAIAKAFKPLLSMAVFGAVGSIIAFSGLSGDLKTITVSSNMAHCIAKGMVGYTGRYYPVFAPLLGWMGTFLTGYGVASIMLFGKLQTSTAAMLGISSPLLVSSLTVGASIGSISSPFKIAIASPLCNSVGREGEILRLSIPIGIAVSLLLGICTYLLV